MRRVLLLTILFLLPLFTLAQDKAKHPLTPGNPLPGTFHPFNVNTALPVEELHADDTPAPRAKVERHAYSTKNKYHCLITEYDLDPTVMLLARGLEDNKALRTLLQKLDSTIENNRRTARLRAFIVFLYDDLKNLTEEDDKRDAIARRLERLVEDLKLRHVVVAFACRSDLARYQLPDDAALTAIIYHKLKIAAHHSLSADKLDQVNDPAIKGILTDVATKLRVKVE